MLKTAFMFVIWPNASVSLHRICLKEIIEEEAGSANRFQLESNLTKLTANGRSKAGGLFRAA